MAPSDFVVKSTCFFVVTRVHRSRNCCSMCTRLLRGALTIWDSCRCVCHAPVPTGSVAHCSAFSAHASYEIVAAHKVNRLLAEKSRWFSKSWVAFTRSVRFLVFGVATCSQTCCCEGGSNAECCATFNYATRVQSKEATNGFFLVKFWWPTPLHIVTHILTHFRLLPTNN